MQSTRFIIILLTLYLCIRNHMNCSFFKNSTLAFSINPRYVSESGEKITTFSEKFQIKRLPGEVLKVLNLPVPTYDLASESAYSLTNLLHSIFGVDVFTLTFIVALYFVASLGTIHKLYIDRIKTFSSPFDNKIITRL